jgi:hypothetical protein
LLILITPPWRRGGKRKFIFQLELTRPCGLSPTLSIQISRLADWQPPAAFFWKSGWNQFLDTDASNDTNVQGSCMTSKRPVKRTFVAEACHRSSGGSGMLCHSRSSPPPSPWQPTMLDKANPKWSIWGLPNWSSRNQRKDPLCSGPPASLHFHTN